jgi:nucleoside-diphosphate-sugar epimerase
MSEQIKKVLVTGGAGYIGSVLVRLLLDGGFKVNVLDCLRSGGESLLEVREHPNFTFFKGDIRDNAAVREAMNGCDAVVHLAAIVGDPACKKEPELARSTNLEGGRLLYAVANELGVKRFVFASTCSNYGKMPDPDSFVVETSELSPLSIYAETKVEFEQYLLGMPRNSVTKPTCLRFSTVYGMSPRIRFDLTVNEFTRELVLGKELLIFGEQFWRPYCHVDDLARSAIAVIEADQNTVAFDVFNVGSTDENYTKRMIVDAISEQVPEAKIEYVKKDEDPRDYRVNFDKIKERLGFTITKRVPDGIREIREILQAGYLNDPYDIRYSNI